MSAAPDIYVLDTSAWFTLIEDEAGAERVQELLEQARASTVVVRNQTTIDWYTPSAVAYGQAEQREANVPIS